MIEIFNFLEKPNNLLNNITIQHCKTNNNIIYKPHSVHWRSRSVINRHRN